MGITQVKEFFSKYGMESKILEFEESSATVELAAQAVGCIPARIAKSLSFKVDNEPVIVVVAGDAKVDNAKYKAFFHTKAKMLTMEEVDALIGHGVGGVCPFAIKDGVRVYLDVSMKRFETVYPAAGNASSAIELTLDEMEKYSGSLGWVDVCKNWQ